MADYEALRAEDQRLTSEISALTAKLKAVHHEMALHKKAEADKARAAGLIEQGISPEVLQAAIKGATATASGEGKAN